VFSARNTYRLESKEFTLKLIASKYTNGILNGVRVVNHAITDGTPASDAE
jgi:hypothetical protein